MEFNNFQSNRFWNETSERQSQKLYVALCLFISAASDFAIGLDLKNSGKLNWSTTASYYSILHSARLIIFLAIGDYPSNNGHKLISNLFAGQPGDRDNYYFGDWVKGFTRTQIRRDPNDKFTLELLCNYYKNSLKLSNADVLFNSIGIILNNAKKLRNHSNYDALLMAHEWHHLQVTDDFTHLSNSMSDGAKLSLEIASYCFEKYIIYEPSIDSNREKIKFLVKNYIFRRLYKATSERIEDQSILQILRKCTKKLENLQIKIEITNDVENDLNDLEKSVSMSRFFDKKDLMNLFKDEVKDLEKNVEVAINNVRQINIEPNNIT